jgi:reactive intermediate/imine deaminase
MSKRIVTEKAPTASGPNSQGICSGNLLFTSGQIPVDPLSGEISEEFEAQTEQVLKNLQALAEAAGTTLARTVKTTCFLTDMGNYARFNAIYADYFTERPARSCIAVKALPRGVLVEVEAIIELR